MRAPNLGPWRPHTRGPHLAEVAPALVGSWSSVAWIGRARLPPNVRPIWPGLGQAWPGLGYNFDRCCPGVVPSWGDVVRCHVWDRHFSGELEALPRSTRYLVCAALRDNAMPPGTQWSACGDTLSIARWRGTLQMRLCSRSARERHIADRRAECGVDHGRFHQLWAGCDKIRVVFDLSWGLSRSLGTAGGPGLTVGRLGSKTGGAHSG